MAWALRAAGAKPVEGPVGVDLTFHTTRRGDADNMLKAMLDAAIGICYGDDAQVVDIGVHIRRDAPPRIDMAVYRPPPDPAAERKSVGTRSR